jgi:SAM-dependent methyltransferase
VSSDLAVSTQARSRATKWELYERLFPPVRGERVLDVGVSALDALPGENYFLDRYPYPEQLTAVGIDDLTGLHGRHPGVTFVQADGRDLPFPDKSFDVVHANAVVEHVGRRPEQARFAAELVRVGRSVFMTTPNRWFPIETHSMLPFLHWLPRPAVERIARAIREPDLTWWLLGRREFKALFPEDVSLRLYTTRTLGMPMTLVIAARS